MAATVPRPPLSTSNSHVSHISKTNRRFNTCFLESQNLLMVIFGKYTSRNSPNGAMQSGITRFFIPRQCWLACVEGSASCYKYRLIFCISMLFN